VSRSSARAEGVTPPPTTVAIVSWNTRELLDGCLRSLRDEHDSGRASVWVVDNGSADGSAELVRSEHPWVTLVERPDNPGFGPAVNEVAARQPSDWLVAANADVAVTPGALQTLLGAAERHPWCGILAPRLVTPDGEGQHSIHPFPGVRTALAVDLGLARLMPGAARRLALEGRIDPLVERDVDWAHGAFLLIRRAAWDATGGFDPSMWLYAEDLDLCWRARRAGWTTRYVPSAVVTHHVSASTAQAWGAARDERSQQAAQAWMRRHLGARRTQHVARIGTAGTGVRALALGLATRLAPERYGWRRERARRRLGQYRAALRDRDAS